jgi:hypothetical protein
MTYPHGFVYAFVQASEEFHRSTAPAEERFRDSLVSILHL